MDSNSEEEEEGRCVALHITVAASVGVVVSLFLGGTDEGDIWENACKIFKFTSRQSRQAG